MPMPRKYESQAARQKAYHDRIRAGMQPKPPAGAPGYPKWRKTLSEAYTLLQATYDELGEYMEQRSDRWRESERGELLDADRDTLYTILDQLDELSIRQGVRS
jgi:hypothetical protein